ncbi:7703_t:CDS:2 [Acaulospora morrowiae]|uniref:7703_t:CDS:1 n=1 Tax=Acaulospora morrowiae TaxID=94023 RepID=A0A9N8YU07_9GLOM|nr:7703_t:CDS:2 [Acaulospora morrowiae]
MEEGISEKTAFTKERVTLKPIIRNYIFTSGKTMPEKLLSPKKEVTFIKKEQQSHLRGKTTGKACQNKNILIKEKKNHIGMNYQSNITIKHRDGYILKRENQVILIDEKEITLPRRSEVLEYFIIFTNGESQFKANNSHQGKRKLHWNEHYPRQEGMDVRIIISK